MRCIAAAPPLTTVRSARRPRAPRAPPRHPRRPGRGPTTTCRLPRTSAKFGAALKGRLGRRAGRGRLTLVCECDALTSEADHPVDLVVSLLGVSGRLTELCNRSG